MDSNLPSICSKCDQSLAGKRYVLKEENQPHCIKCYEDAFGNKCDACSKVIGVDFKDLSYKDMHWHEKCFSCSQCKQSLLNQSFAVKEHNIYCENCYTDNFAPKCDACKAPFKSGMKKYDHQDKQWHEECFTCTLCSKVIGTNSFIERDEDIICIPCYEEKIAKRCTNCQGVINKGGVTFKDEPYHRDCFLCKGCEKILTGDKFICKDNIPYCVQCYGDLFADKCIKCTKPILGLGADTKYLSFDNKYWHSDCFNCQKCEKSLVSEGFLVEGDNVICPTCGR